MIDYLDLLLTQQETEEQNQETLELKNEKEFPPPQQSHPQPESACPEYDHFPASPLSASLLRGRDALTGEAEAENQTVNEKTPKAQKKTKNEHETPRKKENSREEEEETRPETKFPATATDKPPLSRAETDAIQTKYLEPLLPTTFLPTDTRQIRETYSAEPSSPVVSYVPDQMNALISDPDQSVKDKPAERYIMADQLHRHQPDLPQIDTPQPNLAQTDLLQANLPQTDLPRSDIPQANLLRSNPLGTDASRTDLTQIDLPHTLGNPKMLDETQKIGALPLISPPPANEKNDIKRTFPDPLETLLSTEETRLDRLDAFSNAEMVSSTISEPMRATASTNTGKFWIARPAEDAKTPTDLERLPSSKNADALERRLRTQLLSIPPAVLNFDRMESSPSAATADWDELDRRVERDARRYDGALGFY